MSRLARFFSCLFVVALLLGAYALPATALTTEEIVGKSKDSIVRVLIEVKPGDNELLQHYNFKNTRKFKEPIRVKAGTGFVIRKDGYILTAYHVIAPLGMSPRIYVRLPKEGDQLATVVAKDTERQIACLRISKFDLAPLSLIKTLPGVGSDVFTMGFPFAAATSEITDQEATFTEGKVGALKQSRQETTFIQTNAAINLGNSGGPLLNGDGHVLGVIIGSADRSLKQIFEGIFADKDIPVGIGFATPSNPVFDMLKAGGIEIREAIPPQPVKESNPTLWGIIAALAVTLIIMTVIFRKRQSAPHVGPAASPLPPQSAISKSTTISNGTILCTGGELAGNSFSLSEKGLLIGRDNECDIILKADVISRRHSWIGPRGDEIVVRDMGSTNGTFVNGMKIEGSQAVQKGDTISLSKSGQEMFQFAD